MSNNKVNGIIVLFIFLTLTTSAQISITGFAKDSLGKTLIGANVVLLNSTDSLLVQFASVEKTGRFVVELKEPGEYLFRISYIGFKDYEREILIEPSDQLLDLGDLILAPEGYALGVIEVGAARIPIRVRGDTVIYNAEAFKTREGAVVEDLLRRLPGLEVDQAGNMRFQGKPVQEVMVDGKEFFAGNHRMTTQNLPADRVEAVEVFDKKTDEEEISGVDDGEDNTTINLSINEESKGKPFGQVSIASGSQDRYDLGAKIFRLAGTNQLALLGSYNNLNRIGFSFEDYLNFNPSMMSSGEGQIELGARNNGIPLDFGRAITGQNKAGTIGLNLGKDFGKKAEMQGNYVYNRLTQNQNRETDQQFLDPEAELFNRTSNDFDDQSNNHQLTIGFRFKLDSLQRLRLRLSGLAENKNGEYNSETLTATNPTSSLEFLRRQDRVLDNLQLGGNYRLSYRKRFANTKRTFSIRTQSLLAKNEDEEYLVYNGPELAIIGGLNGPGAQNRNLLSKNVVHAVSANFTEPIANSIRLQLGYRLTQEKQTRDWIINTQLDDGDENSLDLDHSRHWASHRPGIEVQWDFGEHKLEIGSEHLSGQLRAPNLLEDPKRYSYFLPNFMLQFKRKRGRMGAYLRSSLRVPSINQLQTVSNFNSERFIALGNVDLNPERNYHLDLRYYTYDQFSGFNFHTNATVTWRKDPIVQALDFTSEKIQISQPANVDKGKDYTLWTNTSKRILGFTVAMRVEGRLQTGMSPLNGILRSFNSSSLQPSLSVERYFGEKFGFNLEYGRRDGKSSYSSGEENKFTNHSFSWMIDLSFLKRWSVAFDGQFNSYQSISFAEETDQLLASGELRYTFPGAGHAVSAHLIDWFNENRGIDRRAEALFLSETRSDILGRYFLLKATIKLK